MSKKSCKAAESIEDAVHDNRIFAKRTFYCIANGACELKFYYTKYKKSVDRKCCSVYNLLSVIQNNSLRFR